MAKIDNTKTDNPKLMTKKLADGRESLYLWYYYGSTTSYDDTGKKITKSDRQKEFLGLYLINSRNPIDKLQNKQTLELAKEIRAEKERELKEQQTGYRIPKTKNINLHDYFKSYINRYTKKDIRVIVMAYNRFKAFLQEDDRYIIYQERLKPEQLTIDMMKSYAEYLESTSKGEGAKTILSRFKKMINNAIEQGILVKNPCASIKCKADDQILKKDVLSIEEMETLIQTTYPEQNQTIRKAFIFCMYSGIRFCDIKELRFKNVDYSNKILSFEQAKTSGKSTSSGVIIPLNDDLLNLIGKPQQNGLDELIFNLPSSTMCNKALSRWTKRAGINKHITWHCARHSFAVNILNNGANIKTVASLLGHSGLKHTEKYTRAVDSLKQDAINSLPKINI
ncbi:MAG: site-specific integrase [Bacteroidales bacterium]|jgi:site-specific recombinase XerD|nr:site-specific integrase [Bacteroidales bacterium]